MEAKAEAEAVALKSTASASLNMTDKSGVRAECESGFEEEGARIEKCFNKR